MFATEISTGGSILDARNIDEKTAEALNNKLNLRNSSNNATTETLERKNNNTEAIVTNGEVLPRSRPPSSGQSTSQSRPTTAGSGQSRPQTASKSVRFAEDNQKGDKLRKEKPSKESCKPDDLDNNGKNEDDPDDKGHPGSRDKGQRSGQGEIRLISAGSGGRSPAEGEKHTSSEKSDTQGKQQNLKQLHSNKLKQSVNSEVCSRYEKMKGAKMPSTLQIQAVGHGGEVHAMICPESPSHRSRSPSPHRRGQRSPSPHRRGHRSPSPQRSKLISPNAEQNRKANKSNRLIRPSSANMSSRQRISSRSHKSRVNEKSPAQILKSKVSFEGDRPQHESIFIENTEGNEVFVEVKEDRAITFEDLEAELNALREDIQDRLVTEEYRNLVESDNSDDDTVVDGQSISLSVDDLLGLSQSEQDLLGINQSEVDIVDEPQQECWKDYSGLLEIYRRKCMDVSENCGEISGKLTTPRRAKAKRRCHSAGKERTLKNYKLKYKGSLQSIYTLDSEKGQSSGVFTAEGSTVGLSHATSNQTIDSGLSLTGSDTRSKVIDPPKLGCDILRSQAGVSAVLDTSNTTDNCVTECEEMPKVKTHPVPRLHLASENGSCADQQEVEGDLDLVVEEVDEDRMIVDTKTLLEMVCDELTTHQNKRVSHTLYQVLI